MHKTTCFIFTYSFLDILEFLNILWTLTKSHNTHKGYSCQKNRLIRILALGFDSKNCSLPLLLLRGRCGSLFWFTGTRIQRLELDPHFSSVFSKRPMNNIKKTINFKRQLLLRI